MAAEFELTDEMRSVIGVGSDPWPLEITTTSVRAFAPGVGYTDPRYFDEEAAISAGLSSLPAPPSISARGCTSLVRAIRPLAARRMSAHGCVTDCRVSSTVE